MRINYKGCVGKRMLALDRRVLAEIRRANRLGWLGYHWEYMALKRLEHQGLIVHLPETRRMAYGYMVKGWRRKIDRSRNPFARWAYDRSTDHEEPKRKWWTPR